MKASAVANANIALVKYWGKRSEEINLPMNSSISMTLNELRTTTTVEFDGKYKKDVVVLNGKILGKGEEYERITRHLSLIRGMEGIRINVKVASKNNFPTAAGLASSASGFAALTLAATKALGIKRSMQELSAVARRGSGSAARSMFGGFVEWEKGVFGDGSDSYAVQIADEKHWKNFRMVIAVTATTAKKVKSRAGMKETVKTSPFYSGWLKSVEDDLRIVRKGIQEKNFAVVGKTAEHNCLKMHALMLSTKPAIFYWNSGTLNAMKKVQELREKGIEAYFTIDAGPQVKVLCLEKNENKVKRELKKTSGVKKIIVSKSGKGAEIVKKHLF